MKIRLTLFDGSDREAVADLGPFKVSDWKDVAMFDSLLKAYTANVPNGYGQLVVISSREWGLT